MESVDDNSQNGIDVSEIEIPIDTTNKRNYAPLPAPFHIRGRRPSAGARLMDLIVEE